ncbi:MAG: hypothetical protein R3199_04315 [Gemmatimonadota bacterium]|nr:hypothetical protein [Gemmatimonadota bacterium]
MRGVTPSLRVLLVALPLLLAACATGGAERGEEEETGRRIVFEVENDLIPRSPVTIHLQATDRPTRVLGTVSAGRTRTFTHTEPLLTGSYRLTAQVHQGEEIPSRVFSLYPRAFIRWSINTNTLSEGIQETDG